jgi:uncharacterized tellurite resistance protein B-like protein/GTPase SAR1 family protein
MTSTLSATELSSTEILTQITGQEIQSYHLTPRVMFLSSLVTVLVGVTYADHVLADEERLYVQRILSQFVLPESETGQMVKLMLQGIRKNRTYTNLDALENLVQTLSASERLLLLGFGCKLATVDGFVGKPENQYLCQVAKVISISNEHLNVLLSRLANEDIDSDRVAIKELFYLLDPQRFKDIDPGIVKAASYIRSKLYKQVQSDFSQARKKPSYEKLKIFQGFRDQLNSICDELASVVKSGQEQGIFPAISGREVAQLSERIRAQRFRLAVVGEFSQGKSTLLNALLGEEIQPVRAIPCSSALTTLKYGAEKRITCYYKDGKQEVIPAEQYQQKASIPEDLALGDRSTGLAESTLTEIVLEHPGLELCRHHVEIVDSPGLNEHPDRTAVTERLLQDADAAIFLANASRPLTQGERELINGLKRQLQKENPDEPADNLFVLVNFMDMLRTQQDKEQVQRLVGNFLQGPNPLLDGDNRIHFISAQAALDTQLDQTENEYSASFSNFVKALEKFLAEERGEIVLKKEIAAVQSSVTGLQNSLAQTLSILDGRINLSESEKLKILEQTGEVSGFDIKMQSLKEELVAETFDKFDEAWKQWTDGLRDRLTSKSDNWTSEREEKRTILKDYAEQFVQDVSEDLDSWLEATVVSIILKPRLKELETLMLQNIMAMKHYFQDLDDKTGANLDKQFELSMSNLGINMGFSSTLDPSAVEDQTGFLHGLSLGGHFGGAIVGAGYLFTGISLLPILLVGGAVGVAASFLFSRSIEEVKQDLKIEAFNKGIEKISESSDEIFDKIVENINSTFDSDANAFHDAASACIRILCNLLEQQENALKETLAQKELESGLIRQKSLALNKIEGDLDLLAKTALL